MARSGLNFFFLLILILQFFTMIIDCNLRFDHCMKYIKHIHLKKSRTAHCVTFILITGGYGPVHRGDIRFDLQMTLKRK